MDEKPNAAEPVETRSRRRRRDSPCRIFPAVVLGCLIRGELRIVLCPGDGNADGGAQWNFPIDQIPFELRMPNTPLWVEINRDASPARIWRRDNTDDPWRSWPPILQRTDNGAADYRQGIMSLLHTILRASLEFLHLRDTPEQQAAKIKLAQDHPDCTAVDRRTLRTEPDRFIVAVFYEQRGVIVRPVRYRLYAVSNDYQRVSELPCGPESPYWIKGRK